MKQIIKYFCIGLGSTTQLLRLLRTSDSSEVLGINPRIL